MAFHTALSVIISIIILYGGFSRTTNVTVTLTAKHHTVGDEYHFFFMCLCDAAPLGCSMQFLKNNKTMETLRQFNDSCYHQTSNVCKGDECSCSSDCMNFTFKYNTTENRTGDIFSCQMRLKEQEGNRMYIYDSIIFNGTGFIHKSKEKTVTQSGVDESTVKATPKASDTGLITGIVCLGIVILLIGLGLGVVVLLKMRNKYKMVKMSDHESTPEK